VRTTPRAPPERHLSVPARGSSGFTCGLAWMDYSAGVICASTFHCFGTGLWIPILWINTMLRRRNASKEISPFLTLNASYRPDVATSSVINPFVSGA